MYFLYLCDECLLCENSTCHKNKAVFNNQNLATFLMLGKNPCMLSGKITFLRDSCGGFALTSKTKRHFDYWTPPYFCDMCYFHRVDIHHMNIKKYIEKVNQRFYIHFK